MERGQLLPQKAESSPRPSMGRRGSRAQAWGTPESESLVSSDPNLNRGSTRLTLVRSRKMMV